MAQPPRDPKFPFLGPIDRRKFLQTLTQAAAVLAAGELAAGCGSSPAGNPFGGAPADATGSGTVPGAPLPNTKAITGTVNTAQIGGLGLLVQSAFQLNSPVTTGQFNTRISEVGPQLLFVLDAAGKLRGLAISQPGDTLVTLDAHSTALALVFLTLGILTLDPADAATRLQQIAALPAFTALRTYLAGKLTGTDLGLLSQDASLLALLDAVRVAFDALAPLPKATVSSGQVDAAFNDDKSTNVSAAVDLSNFAWRYVALRRIELDSTHKPITLPLSPDLEDAQSLTKSNLLSGVNTLNWGNLFTNQFHTPGTATDRIDLTQSPNTDFLQYVVIGPGNPFLNVPLPPSISPEAFAADEAKAIIMTIVFYWVGPFLDLAAGGIHFNAISFASLEKLATDLASAGLSVADFKNAWNSNENGNNDANVTSAAINLMVLIVGASGGALVALAAGTAAAPFVAAAVAAFAVTAAVSGLIFAFNNLGKAIRTLTDTPAVGVLELSTKKQDRYNITVVDTKAIDRPGNAGGLKASLNNLGHVLYMRDTFPSLEIVLWKSATSSSVITTPNFLMGSLTNLSNTDQFAYVENDGGFGTVATAVLVAGGEHTPISVGPIGGSFPVPWSINDSGIVVGHYQFPPIGFASKVFRWNLDTGASKVGDQLDSSTKGVIINKHDEILSQLVTDQPFPNFEHLTLRSGITLTQIGSAGNRTGGYDLNDSGQVLFTDQGPPPSTLSIPAIWEAGTTTLLPNLNNTILRTVAINNHGEAIGMARPGLDGLDNPVLWKGGTVTNIAEHVNFTAELPRVPLFDVVDINDTGQILAFLGTTSLDLVLVLLTPIP